MIAGSHNTILDYRGYLSSLEHDQQSLSKRPRPRLEQSDAGLVGRGEKED